MHSQGYDEWNNKLAALNYPKGMGEICGPYYSCSCLERAKMGWMYSYVHYCKTMNLDFGHCEKCGFW